MPRHSSNFQETPVQNALPAVQALADAAEPNGGGWAINEEFADWAQF